MDRERFFCCILIYLVSICRYKYNITKSNKTYMDCTLPATYTQGSPKNATTRPSYILYEMDWVLIEEFMDLAHSFPLYVLCSSSYVSSTCLGGTKAPWVHLLYHMPLPMLRVVMNTIREGMYVCQHDH